MGRKKNETIKQVEVLDAKDSTFLEDENGQLEVFSEDRKRSFGNIIKKSNSLINRIGKVTLLSEKILLVALANTRYIEPGVLSGTLEEVYFKDILAKTGTYFGEGYISSFKNTELRKILGNNSGSYYEQIDKLMNTPNFAESWKIIYKDKDIIGFTNLVMGTTYDSRTGTTYIKWNPDMKEKIINLTSNYTELDKSIVFKFKTLYSFSLYQILRSRLCLAIDKDKRRGYPILTEYTFSFDLSEFKFLTGVLSVDIGSKNSEAATVVKSLQNEQFFQAEQFLPDSIKKYTKYTDIRRYVLDKVFKEVNGFDNNNYEEENIDEYLKNCENIHKTDMHFRFRPIKSGIGGKVSAVEFLVRWDKTADNKYIGNSQIVQSDKPDVVETVEDKVNNGHMEMLEKLSELIKEPLSFADLKTIATAADWDLEKVRKAYNISQFSKIHNLVGFLLKAIKENYEEPVAAEKKKKTKKSSAEAYLGRYSQREYTEGQMLHIEKEMLRSSLDIDIPRTDDEEDL